MLRLTRPVVLFLPLLLLLSSCSRTGPGSGGAGGDQQAGRTGARGAAAPVPVVTARVEQRAMPLMLTAVGTVEAIASVQIRAQVTGQLSTIHFAEGQEVTRGQRLFTLDSRSFRATLQQAEAVLARDTATLENARAQQVRTESLFKRGLLSRDQYESQRAVATALSATVEADKAAVETARLNVQYTEISAPISGRTGSLGAHEGDLVRANDTAPLIVINQMSPVYVVFSVPGRELSAVRRYQAQKPLMVTATAAAGSTAEAPSAGNAGVSQGVVSFVDNAVDATTGMIRLKATFPNAGRQLWPGVFVQVVLQLTTVDNALVVPATAVQASQDGQYVWVVKPDTVVEMRPVTVERQQGDQIVIATGVVAGEVVVTDGQLRLTPGARTTERATPGATTPEGPRPGGNQAPDRLGAS